ncbi:MAG: NADP-dependent glyceraldehyde-3-phosphate dehydrogenase [Actinobacteria bacterium]|nr:NADP-dependent glyceraldehyde-3-phosphate dehydrogenase [Actinomycetota bacterium]
MKNWRRSSPARGSATAGRAAAVFPTPGQVPPEHRLPGQLEQSEYLVGGRLRTWKGPMQEVFSPLLMRHGSARRRVRLGAYPLQGAKESLAALAAATRAYDHGRGAWPTLPVAERIRSVEAFAGAMATRRAEVVRLLMWEVGKSLSDSEKEFDRTVDYIRRTVDALKDLDRVSSRFVIEEGVFAQIRRAPLGVALCMGPFNYPLNETFTTLIPALIMGNTVVFKPPKLGVLLWRPLLEAFRDCFPPGVVNTVYGEGAAVVGPLMESGGVDVLAFIGTSRVADILKHQHPRPHRLRSVLGLDAKNPAIVLADADLGNAVGECLLGALSFNGQRCTALKILFVHSSIADEFVGRLAAAVDALPVGMPWEPGVWVTPLAEPGKPAYLRDLVDDALGKGSAIRNAAGGTVHGTYFHPAVLYPAAGGMRVWDEEQFGPVIPVVPFDDIAAPLDYVVHSPFGQQISLFGTGPAAVARLIDPLVNQVCRVNLNSQCQRGPDAFPFTGRKDSAEGTLSVTDALRVFSIRTLVAAKGSEANKELAAAIVRGRRSSFLSTDFIL